MRRRTHLSEARTNRLFIPQRCLRHRCQLLRTHHLSLWISRHLMHYPLTCRLHPRMCGGRVTKFCGLLFIMILSTMTRKIAQVLHRGPSHQAITYGAHHLARMEMLHSITIHAQVLSCRHVASRLSPRHRSLFLEMTHLAPLRCTRGRRRHQPRCIT